jgi:hypothetical protein
VENEIVTGTLVAVQIKAGESFLKQYTGNQYFSVHASKEDLNYWNNPVIPVALIVYDPVTKLSGWLDVKLHPVIQLMRGGIHCAHLQSLGHKTRV